MINDLIEYLKNKKIVILGFGKEGISTYRLIRKYLKNQELCIADKEENFAQKHEFLAEDNFVKIVDGENYLDDLKNYDIIMKSPGVSFKNVDTTEFQDKIKSQLELLLEFFNVFTIGITGTKGKSTTSSLIYEILQDQGKDSLFLGNIGNPIFENIEKIDENVVIVLEISSHQLEYMKKSPNISILLNIFEEHLDHYNSFEDYIQAKLNIYKYQNSNDYFLYNIDNDILRQKVGITNSQTYKLSMSQIADIYVDKEDVFFQNEKIYNINEKRNLVGEYNLSNIIFALSVAKILNLDIQKAIKSVGEFKTLEHRLELVGKYDGIYFYDNCIATVPVATINAIEALKNVDTLIIGGMDRGINYNTFIQYLNKSQISNIICMPKTGHDIAQKLDKEKVYIVETLEEAVEIARKVTKKEHSCLLSPAAASYGFFKNFNEKGDKYKSIVKKIH